MGKDYLHSLTAYSLLEWSRKPWK